MVSLVILALFNRNTPSFPRRGERRGEVIFLYFSSSSG